MISGRLEMGREGWFDEVMRFYDRFLKGVEPSVEDPQVAVQTNDGKWRAEEVWPPADAVSYTSPLRSGSYFDDGFGGAWGSSATSGVWTISPPLPHDAHLAGSGRAVVDVSSPPREVDVYDVDEDGEATLVMRQVAGREFPVGRPQVERVPAAAPQQVRHDRRPRGRCERGLVAARRDAGDGDGARRRGRAAVPHG